MKREALLERLTAYIDGELGERAMRETRELLERDRTAALLCERLRSAGTAFGEAVLLAAGAGERRDASACPDAAELAALADGRIALEREIEIRDHLASCPACLRACLDCMRIERRLARGGWSEIPAALRVRVRERLAGRPLVHARTRAEPEEPSARIEIDSRAGPGTVRREVVFGGLRLAFVFQARPGRPGVDMDLRLSDRGRAEAGRRLTLVDTERRRKHAVGTTDRSGRWQAGALAPGRYTLHLLGRSETVELALDS